MRPNWLAALLTSSALYVLIGVVVVLIGTATKKFIAPPPPVEVTFVEKVARPETPPPPPVVEPKAKPPLVSPKLEVKPRQRAPAAAAVVPKHLKVRKLDAPPPPKELVAPQEAPKEPAKEADPSEDKGIAVYGEPGVGDAAGLEGGVGDAAGNTVGGFELPEGAVAPKPYKNNRKPEYPRSALANRDEAVVVFHCVVRADGYLDDIELTSGDEPFATFARRALRRWRYEPALLHGQPISVPHVIELRFSIRHA